MPYAPASREHHGYLDSKFLSSNYHAKQESERGDMRPDLKFFSISKSYLKMQLLVFKTNDFFKISNWANHQVLRRNNRQKEIDYMLSLPDADNM
jgi:hypothetical protein